MAYTTRLALAGLFLLLIASYGCVGSAAGVAKTQVMGWHLLAGLAVMIVVLLLALGYMAAVFVDDNRLKAWVVRELGQAFFSVLIIIFAVALAGSLDQLLHVVSLAGGPQWQSYVNNGVCCTPGAACISPAGMVPRGRACHIEIATDYLQVLYESTRQSARAQLNNYNMYAFLSHLSYNTSLVFKFLAGVNTTPFAGLELAADFFSILFDLSIKTMMLLRAQQIFLDFLWYPIFPLMLSMGLVLRVFYFTRKLGGMLIALGLSLYIVFPMFYVLANGIMWGFTNSNGGMTHVGLTYNSNELSGGTPLPFYGSESTAPQQRAKDLFAPGRSIVVDLCNQSTPADYQEMESEKGKFTSNFDAIEGGNWWSQYGTFVTGQGFSKNGPIANLAFLMVFTMAIPFLALMTALASFKLFSPLIGGDVEISLLSRLI